MSRSRRLRFSVGGERLPVATRLDGLPQPDALLVVGDVLDLVGDRPAVGLVQRGQGIGEGLARDVQAQVPRRDPRLELRGERRLEALGLERRVADGFGAERVELRGEVAVHAVRLDERHRCGDAAEEHVVRGLGRSRRRGRACCRFGRSAVPVGLEGLEELHQPGMGGDELAVAALEQASPLRRDCLGVLEVLVEERPCVAGVQSVDVERAHSACCSSSLRRGGGPSPRQSTCRG